MKKLENKVAVVYGDGTIGATIAKAFALEGARVFLTGRTVEKLDAIAREIQFDGGTIETAQLDALDEQAVEKHMNEIVAKTGKIDISFNAIGIPQQDVPNISLIELSAESFMLPIITYSKSHFITGKAAAKYMVQQGNGVILNHTPNASRISTPFSGGLVPAWAAIEALIRSLSVEYGQKGVRAVTLLTTALPETTLIKERAKTRAQSLGITPEQFYATMAGQTHRNRLTTLEELKNAAVFVASDEGSAISGTILNLTAGIIVN